MSDKIGQLIEKTQKGQARDLARLLTAVESQGPGVLTEKALLRPARPAFRLGLTGPPGAGKSTLIGELLKEFRQKNWKVGVLAVDPSSPFTHGAVLGDRVRYAEHFNDPEVFIRSIGTRGSLGGLSAAAYLMLRAYDLYGFDIVLIETVGVGQTELEIMHVADEVGVVLVPESGDAIQAMKAGLLEIANFFVVNKSDRPGADSLARELEASAQLNPHSSPVPQLFKTKALQGEGVKSVADYLEEKKQQGQWSSHRENPARLQYEARALLRRVAEEKMDAAVQGVQSPADLQKLVLQPPF